MLRSAPLAGPLAALIAASLAVSLTTASLAQNAPPYNLPHNSTRLGTDAFIFQPLGSTKVDYTTRAELFSGYELSPPYPIYNVRRSPYSAAGNGATDDTTPIASAISDACAAGRGEVYLPVGTYKVSSALSIACAGVSIRGDGPGNTLLVTSSTTANVLNFGNIASAYSPCGGARNLSITSSVTRTTGIALNVDGCENGTFDNLRIATTGGNGVSFAATNHLATIHFLSHFDIEISGAFYGISIGGGNDRFIHDGWIRGNSTTGSRGLLITASGGDWIHDVDIVQFEYGIFVNPGSGQSATWLDFATVESDTNTLQGWRFSAGAGGAIRGITCYSCWAGTNGAASANGRGIYIGNGDGYSFIAPRIINNGGHGIELAGGSNVSISGAQIGGNSAASSGTAHGIIATSVTGLRVLHSTIGTVAGTSGTQGYGIFVNTGTSRFEIAYNDLTGNVTGAVNNSIGASSTGIVEQNVPYAASTDFHNAGIAGGQAIRGGTAASDPLTLTSTANATKGKILFGTSAYDETNNRLGINWASPDVLLAVSGNAAALPAPSTGTLAHLGGTDATAVRLAIDGFGAGGLPGLTFRRSLGTAASRTALGAANTFGSIYWQGAYDATNYSGDVAQIGCETAEAFTSTAQGTNCFIGTTHIGGTTLERRYTVDSAGHIVWGTSTTSPTVACTGTGTSPAAPTIAGVDSAFTITVNTGTGSPGSSGTCTVTFGTAYVTNMPVLVCTPQNGATAWGVGSGVMVSAKSLSAPVLTWWNEAAGVLTALATSTSYQISCHVDGKGN